MPQQMAEEFTYPFLPDILEMELVVEAQLLSFRADGDSCDEGDFVPPIAMTNDGSAATRCPGRDHIRDQQESGFIGEHWMGAQLRGVFLPGGHSFRF